ncbi:alpha/beta fold hydrolase [Pseudomonas sp. GD03860]|uniref:alpha/beta hydrolase family protein n=1 Tax=Pseudomonas TaxID=286 RepID=UPI002364508A|nr:MULTISPECIES: alpha/beta fold hydrolase [Pseudomonas]MDD2058275.1 alpha/beta fold hydrolase [Pseudomonas putida]MDH0636208.1 alpha/beta fold hydrolase [Pseudomonas sp. GD03860]
MSMMEQTVQCPDGTRLHASLHTPDNTPTDTPVIVIAGALGVPMRFYSRFAEFLADRGYRVMTFNYRGTGKAAGPMPSELLRLENWGRQDLDSMLGSALALAGGQPVYLIGHSIGAQLLGLAPRSRALHGAVFVGASFAYWRRWPSPQRVKYWTLFKLLIPLLTRLSPTFPARAVGLGSENLPSSLMRDWATWVNHPDYLLSPAAGLDAAQAYRTLSLQVLSLQFADDAYVPPAAAQKLYSSYPALHFELRHKADLPAPVGHFGFFREVSGAPYWPEVLAWLHAQHPVSTGEQHAQGR